MPMATITNRTTTPKAIQSPTDIERSFALLRVPHFMVRHVMPQTGSLRLEDQLAEHGARIEQFMRLPRLGKRQTPVDRRAHAAGGKNLDRACRHALPAFEIMIEAVHGEAAHARALRQMRPHLAEKVFLGKPAQRVERDDQAEWRERLEIVGEILADDVIEDEIDAMPACKVEQALRHALAAVIDRMCCPLALGESAFRGRTGAGNDGDVLQAAKLDDRRADTTGRAIHIDRLRREAARG